MPKPLARAGAFPEEWEPNKAPATRRLSKNSTFVHPAVHVLA